MNNLQRCKEQVLNRTLDYVGVVEAVEFEVERNTLVDRVDDRETTLADTQRTVVSLAREHPLYRIRTDRSRHELFLTTPHAQEWYAYYTKAYTREKRSGSYEVPGWDRNPDLPRKSPDTEKLHYPMRKTRVHYLGHIGGETHYGERDLKSLDPLPIEMMRLLHNLRWTADFLFDQVKG